jgi:6-pyruvoyltetrahydropterin/6-carboxytetrahydropterin synthase
VDTNRLDLLVRAQVLDAFDHRNLNEQVEMFRTVVPTSENLGVEIFRRLRDGWPTAFEGPWPKLAKVRIAETPRNIFEVSSDEIE